MSHTPPHPQGPQLPTEICEEIISYVDDQEMLRACSLVCRSWVPRSRVQLYRSATVTGERIHKFLDMIVMYPHLGVNVKQLFLRDRRGDSTDIYRFFSDIIPLLPKIISLSYNSLPIPYLHLPLFSSGLLSLTSLTLWRIEANSFGDFCLVIRDPEFYEKPVVPSIADGLAMRWATTMKATYLDFNRGIEKAGDAKEAVVSSLTAYIRFCPNLQTVTLDISEDTLWVLRQLPDVLSGLVSLRRIAFQLLTEVEADVILLGDNAKTWTTLDEDLGDRAKFRSLEYVEVLCRTDEKEKAPSWWENDTGSSEDGESDSGREFDGEDGEVECREENLRGETCEVEMTYDLAELRPMMNRVALFHRHKKSLTDLFPRLSKRGVLWCSIGNHNIYRYVLQVTASNLVGMKSHNWRPRYCESLFRKPLEYD
ncbi:hypothetical protein NLI96_g11211 [Meripilus lineatus]|uniref:F-box domain-containing protein n=1 Tax=Meripilus lineatus TaxID=2056292 RepID=A0AAD5YB81_9APHY|nr:hypothetical protein NLI96_g11211 [Physisporinus lineatus]